MKPQLSTFAAGLAAAAALGAPALADPSFSLGASFESSDVFRGSQLAKQTIKPNVEMIVPSDKWELYIGANAFIPINQPDVGDYDFPVRGQLYLGGALNPFDGVWLDAGASRYVTGDEDAGLFHATEDHTQFHAGAFMDMEVLNRSFTPSLFVFHDSERSETVLEGAADYSRLVGPNLWIDLGAYAGGVLNVDGTERAFDGLGLAIMDIPEYAYYGAEADVRIDLSGRAEIFAGARYTGASEDRFIETTSDITGEPNAFDSGRFWMSAGVRASF